MRSEINFLTTWYWVARLEIATGRHLCVADGMGGPCVKSRFILPFGNNHQPNIRPGILEQQRIDETVNRIAAFFKHAPFDKGVDHRSTCTGFHNHRHMTQPGQVS